MSTRCQSGSPPSVDVREVPSERAINQPWRGPVPAARQLDYSCLAGHIEAMEVSVSESAAERRIDHSPDPERLRAKSIFRQRVSSPRVRVVRCQGEKPKNRTLSDLTETET